MFTSDILVHLKNKEQVKEWARKKDFLIGQFRYWATNKGGSMENVKTESEKPIFFSNYFRLKVIIPPNGIDNLEEGEWYKFKFYLEDNPINENGYDFHLTPQSQILLKPSVKEESMVSGKEIPKTSSYPKREPNNSTSSHNPPQGTKENSSSASLADNEKDHLDEFISSGDPAIIQTVLESEEEFDLIKTGKKSKRRFISDKIKNTGKRRFFKNDQTDEELKKIGNQGEIYLYEKLPEEFKKVTWFNKEFIESDINTSDDSGMPYDFEVTDENGHSFFIECKATNSDSRTFFMSDNEWEKLRLLSPRNEYQIYRVFNLDSQPDHIIIKNPLQSLLDGTLVPYMVDQIREIDSHKVILTYLG